MSIINLCQHAVNLSCGVSIPASGVEARVDSKSVVVDRIMIDGKVVEILETVFGGVINLPEYKKDVFYVVSGMVRAALPNRADLYSPGILVRDTAGVVQGCRGLVRNTQ